METYLTLLYVTLEQEVALKDFFTEKGWQYCKPDLSVLTDKIGPVESPQSIKTGGIVTDCGLNEHDRYEKPNTYNVLSSRIGKKVKTPTDVEDIKVEFITADEFTTKTVDTEKDVTEEQTENDDGDNDDDFADDLAINEEENDTEDSSSPKTHGKRVVRKSPSKQSRETSHRTQQVGCSSTDQQECLATGHKRRKVADKAEAKNEPAMSEEHEENKDKESLYDKRYFRSLLTEALKSSPSGKETAKSEFSVCPQCRKSVRNTSMRRHLLSHLGLPYRCTRCTLFFTSEAALEKHRQEKHIGEFVCSYCGMEYRFKNSLAEHIQTRHEGTAKMYECPVCGVKMCRKSHMDDHMNVHNNVNPYSCENCGKSYKNKSAYKRHLKDCGSGNKYICDECGQIYKSATGLQDHSKRCHDKTYSYQCYCVCGGSFRTRASRCRHRLQCDMYQKEKDSKSNSFEQNITILRVTTTPKMEHRANEYSRVSHIRANEEGQCQELKKVFAEHLNETSNLNSTDERENGNVDGVEEEENSKLDSVEPGEISVTRENVHAIHGNSDNCDETL